MRFSFVSLALLALAHPLAPGVHGAPAGTCDLVKAIQQSLGQLVQEAGIPLKEAEQIVKGLLPRAVTSPALSAPSTTTTNVSLPTSVVGNSSGVSSQGKPTPLPVSGVPRQLPTLSLPVSLPINPTAAIASTIPPLESIISSISAGVHKSAESKPTSTSQA